MEIETEVPGSRRARSWRENAAQDDAKKLEGNGHLTKVNITCGCLSVSITLMEARSQFRVPFGPFVLYL